ncbi:hypothetical protein HJFPF1_01554 [Paramyrothecium foliicola]|nr:hypothetical protein HJFPF1_01554 [Paramyrothecium foliicola]
MAKLSQALAGSTGLLEDDQTAFSDARRLVIIIIAWTIDSWLTTLWSQPSFGRIPLEQTLRHCSIREESHMGTVARE